MPFPRVVSQALIRYTEIMPNSTIPNQPEPMNPSVPEITPMEFKPNMYPIMYWALAFGAAAAVLLFVLFLLSQVIAIAWFPVFLTGLIWGGYRNYKKQKEAWAASTGTAPSMGSPMDEFKQAASDIANASRDLIQQEAPLEENISPEPAVEEEPETPPTPPTQPPI